MGIPLWSDKTSLKDVLDRSRMENKLEQRVQELIAAGSSASHAAAFAATSLAPSEVVKYENAGLVLEHLHDCQTLQIEPLDLRKWLDLLFLSSYVHQVVKMEISFKEAQQIFNEKVEPERSTLIQLLEDGTSVEEILLLRQMGVYFFRTGASKERPLREIFMDSAFGSAAIRKAWELTNASTRQAMIAKQSGVTPYGYVVGSERGLEPPRCSWVIDEKKYQFDSPLPEAFLSSLGRKRNDGFLEAVGYLVGTRNLKSEFLEELNPAILFETKRINGKKFLIGLTFSQELWHAKFLAIGADALEVEIFGSLAQVGAQALEKLDSLGYKVRSIMVRPSLKAANSEYFRMFANWFTEVGNEDLPEINGELATAYVAIDGTHLVAPLEESLGRPGTDEIRRYGDVAYHFVGSDPNPIVVISGGDDAEIRKLTEPIRALTPPNIFSEILINRHVLREEKNYKSVDSDEDIETWLESYDTFENFMNITELRSRATSGDFTINPHEIVEIWFDEKALSLLEVLNNLEIVGEDVDGLENGKNWESLRQIAENEHVPFLEYTNDFFLTRPPVVINGSAYLPVREDSRVLLELDEFHDDPWPEIQDLIGQFSLIELDSRVSGTDWDEIGFVRPDVLVNRVRLDEGENHIEVWTNISGDASSELAQWLLSDDYGHKFKALLFVEGRLGNLPEGNEIFADWLDENMSSTLEIGFSFGVSDEPTEENVLQLLMKDRDVAEFVKGITEPDSDEGKSRTKRQEAYRALHYCERN